MEYDFPSQVEALDKVPESFRPYYAENADKTGFVIADAFKPIIEMYTGTNKAFKDVSSANKKNNSEAAARRVALTKIGDSAATLLGIDLKDKNLDTDLPELLSTALADLAAKATGGDKLKIDMKAVQEAADRRVAEATTVNTGKLDKMRTSLERHMIDKEAITAISALKGVPDLLLPHVKGAARVVEAEGGEYVAVVVDAQGNARPNGKGGTMTIADFVAELKGNATFARAFESEAKGGSGSNQRQAGGAPARQQTEMSSQDKIAAGLKARGVQAG